jgi:hypothetical protein
MKLFLIALSLTVPLISQGATIVNGSLTGPSDSYSLIPPGWSMLSDSNSEPDTEGANGPTEIYNLSPDGGTFVGAAYAKSQIPNGFEGIQQLVNDFIPGVKYRVDFYQSNLGVNTTNIVDFLGLRLEDWNAEANWQLYIDGLPTGLYSSVLKPEVGALPNNTWYESSIYFIANSSAAMIGFVPNIVVGDNTFLGIDGIRISVASNDANEIPEPTSMLLVLASLASAIAVRKARR